MVAITAVRTGRFYRPGNNPGTHVLNLLHKVQLHVSALDSGHLQVVPEIFIK